MDCAALSGGTGTLADLVQDVPASEVFRDPIPGITSDLTDPIDDPIVGSWGRRRPKVKGYLEFFTQPCYYT